MAFDPKPYVAPDDSEFVITDYDDNWAIVRRDGKDTLDNDLMRDPSKREVFFDKAVALARLEALNTGKADREFASQKSQQDLAVEAEAKDDERETRARQPPAKAAAAQPAPRAAAPAPAPAKS